VLVNLGPITQDYIVSPGLSSDMRWVSAAELNDLRDELIELRADRAELAILRPAAHATSKPDGGDPC
jgi:hypothetical protein